jgi:hypothetical protein
MKITRLIERLVTGIVATILVIVALIRLRGIRKEAYWKMAERDQGNRNPRK